MKIYDVDRWNKWDRIYWFFRYGIWNWLSDLKWRIPNWWQRGLNGWGFADTWRFDTYLSRIIIEGIKHLKKHQHGLPVDIAERHRKMKNAEKEWNKIIDKIIRTFEIHLKWTDYGQFPTEKEKKEYEEGWKLFSEYFGDLWD